MSQDFIFIPAECQTTRSAFQSPFYFCCLYGYHGLTELCRIPFQVFTSRNGTDVLLWDEKRFFVKHHTGLQGRETETTLENSEFVRVVLKEQNRGRLWNSGKMGGHTMKNWQHEADVYWKPWQLCPDPGCSPLVIYISFYTTLYCMHYASVTFFIQISFVCVQKPPSSFWFLLIRTLKNTTKLNSLGSLLQYLKCIKLLAQLC